MNSTIESVEEALSLMRIHFDSAPKLLVWSILLAAGCSDAETENSKTKKADLDIAPAKKTAGATAASDADGTVSADGFTFTLPRGWTKRTLSQFQMSVIAAKVGRDVDGVDITATFSSAGGGVPANLERWEGQFPGAQPETKKIEVAGMSATWIDLRGRYQGMMQSNEDTSDYRMLGVAVERQTQDFYIKLVGPRAAVTKVENEFRQMVESAK